jgi:LacI family transcriptional regulator, sucrose operon repressor
MTSSLQQIARLSGVSTTTVSLVINNKHQKYRIAPATVKKVLAVVRDRRYLPNQYARGFRLQRTGTIGLVVGDVTNWFFSLIEQSIEEEARAQGFNLIIASSDDDPARESETVEALLSKSVDGLILASVHPDARNHQAANRKKTPFVYIDRRIRGASEYVVSDNRQATVNLMRRWISAGVRCPAFIGGGTLFWTHNERLAGFRDAFRKAGIPARNALIFEGNFKPDFGYYCMARLLKQKPLPDAVFTASFTLLSGVLGCLKEAGFQKPSFKLGTFDDHPLLDLLEIPVDSIAQDCAKIGKAAFSMLLNRMHEGKISSCVVKSKIITRE